MFFFICYQSPAPLQSSQQQRTQNGDESFYHSNNSQYHQQNNTSHHQNNYSHQQQHQNHTNTYPSTVNAASTSTPVAATLVVPTTISTATAMPQVCFSPHTFVMFYVWWWYRMWVYCFFNSCYFYCVIDYHFVRPYCQLRSRKSHTQIVYVLTRSWCLSSSPLA